MTTHSTLHYYVPSGLLSFICCFTLLFAAPLSGQQGDWTAVNTSGISPEGRHESGFVEVDGTFYLLGGRGSKKIQAYNPTTKQWRNTTTSLNNIHHFQARAYQGKIYLLGALEGGYPNEKPLTQVLIYDPVQDKLSTGATMPANRRRGSSGVVLHNDVFYIVAGNRNGHSAFLDDGKTPANVSWTDKYDPATGQWTVLPDAPHARDHFFAEVIGDKLYVAGGRRSKFGTPAGTWSDMETAVDVFDLTTEKWLSGSAVPAKLPTARAGAATAVINNELLVIGGEIDSNPPGDLALPHTEILNTSTGTWRRADDLLLQRHGTQAILYQNGVYVAGGSKTKGGTDIQANETFVEAFSYSGLGGTEYKNWTTIGTAPIGFSEAAMVPYRGEYYFFNGFDESIDIHYQTLKYNPATNSWTKLKTMPTPGGRQTAVTHNGTVLVNNEIWIIGGRVGDNPGRVTDEVWIYTIATDSWRKGPTLPARRGGGAAARLGDEIHYAGGFDEDAKCDVADHLVYDLDNPSAGWNDLTDQSPMPLPRNHSGTAALNGKLYVLGGQNGHDGGTCGGAKDNGIAHVYDPRTDKWTRIADLPQAQSHAEPSTFTYNNRIYVVGGQVGNGKKVMEYDPTTDMWTVLGAVELPQHLLAPGARIYQENLFVIAGGNPDVKNPTDQVRVKNFPTGSAASLAFNAPALNYQLAGQEDQTTSLILSNLNAEESTPFRIATDELPSWLSVDKASGLAVASSTEIELTVTSEGLQAGTYTHILAATSSGYTTATIPITLVVDDGGGTPGDAQSIYLEAECATVGSLWQTISENAASGGSYVTVTPGNTTYDTAPTQAAARVTFTTQLSAAGNYKLFARIKAPNSGDDSFWVRINNGAWIKYWQGLQTGNQFDWKEVLGSPFSLPAGTTTIDFAYREDGTQLDKLFLTTDGSNPSGFGGEAINCGSTPSPEPATAIRINAGGPATSYQGNQFSADENFTGGKTYINTSATVPPLYQTERSSEAPFQYTYRVPVPDGEYTVRLHFAEIYFGANGGGPAGSGKRVFDVTLENQLVLNNYDINADVGAQTEVVKEYNVQVTDGAVDIFFDASAAAGGTNQPKLSALEVIGESSGTTPPPQATTELWAEAECTSTGSNWTRGTGNNSSAGAYLVYPGNANKPAPQASTNAAELLTYKVDLTEGGSYRLFVRMNTPPPASAGKNSFWVSVDGGKWLKFWKDLGSTDLETKGFEWRQVSDDGQAVVLNLASGSHTIRVAPRETGTQLDKLYLGKQTSAPNGLGKEATNCGSGSSASANFAANTFSTDQNHSVGVEPSISLYPNPVTDRLTFKLSGVPTASEAQVLDLYGRVVLRQAYTTEGSTVAYLNVATLPAATYYLRVIGEGITPLLQPFVKQ